MIRLKRDVDLALEQLAQAGFDSILFPLREGRGGRDRHLLRAFGLIDEFAKRIGNLRKKADAVLPHQLSQKALADWRTSKTGSKRGEDGYFVLHPESWRGDGMAERGRGLERVTKPV